MSALHSAIDRAAAHHAEQIRLLAAKMKAELSGKHYKRSLAQRIVWMRRKEKA